MELNLNEVNLYKVLKNLYDELQKFAKVKNIHLNLINDVEEPVVLSDNYIIEQVFQNLIENAIKYAKKAACIPVLRIRRSHRCILRHAYSCQSQMGGRAYFFFFSFT